MLLTTVYSNYYVCSNDQLPLCVDNTSRVCLESVDETGNPANCTYGTDCAAGRSCSFLDKCEGQTQIIRVECPENVFCKDTPL